MERKNVIYTILNKNDNLTPFPYPPLYQENDMDAAWNGTHRWKENPEQVQRRL